MKGERGRRGKEKRVVFKTENYPEYLFHYDPVLSLIGLYAYV